MKKEMKNLLMISAIAVIGLSACTSSNNDDDDDNNDPNGTCPAEYIGTWMISKSTSQGAVKDSTITYNGEYVYILKSNVGVQNGTYFEWRVDENNTFWMKPSTQWYGTRKTQSINNTTWEFKNQLAPTMFITNTLTKINPNPDWYKGSWKAYNTRKKIRDTYDWDKPSESLDVTAEWSDKLLVLNADGKSLELTDTISIDQSSKRWLVAGKYLWIYDVTIWSNMEILEGAPTEELWLVYKKDESEMYRFKMRKEE